jgi:hypothetical protein
MFFSTMNKQLSFNLIVSVHFMFPSNQIYTKRKLSNVNGKSLLNGKLFLPGHMNFILTNTKYNILSTKHMPRLYSSLVQNRNPERSDKKTHILQPS